MFMVSCVIFYDFGPGMEVHFKYVIEWDPECQDILRLFMIVCRL